MLGLQLVGVVVQQRPWLMVLEFLQYGDLRSVLKGCAAKGIELDYPEQLSIASQVKMNPLPKKKKRVYSPSRPHSKQGQRLRLTWLLILLFPFVLNTLFRFADRRRHGLYCGEAHGTHGSGCT